jgi:hypothetical protein
MFCIIWIVKSGRFQQTGHTTWEKQMHKEFSNLATWKTKTYWRIILKCVLRTLFWKCELIPQWYFEPLDCDTTVFPFDIHDVVIFASL